MKAGLTSEKEAWQKMSIQNRWCRVQFISLKQYSIKSLIERFYCLILLIATKLSAYQTCMKLMSPFFFDDGTQERIFYHLLFKESTTFRGSPSTVHIQVFLAGQWRVLDDSMAHGPQLYWHLFKHLGTYIGVCVITILRREKLMFFFLIDGTNNRWPFNQPLRSVRMGTMQM